jgi:hypothetical protein
VATSSIESEGKDKRLKKRVINGCPHDGFLHNLLQTLESISILAVEESF